MPWGELAHERPPWMRVRLRTAGSRYDELDGIVRSEGLHTVCEEARCPNIGECWGRGPATLQIMGDHERALWLLRRAREVWDERWPERGPLVVKSGIVAGMGESDDEIVDTLADLRAQGVDVVTIGQYLQPTERHLPLARWVPLES